MLLAPIPWAGRVWALPFLTVLAPSERYDQAHKRRHKTLARWAQQMVIQIRRWLPERALVLVADSGYSALTFLNRCASLPQSVTAVTRLRLDAALFEPAPERCAGQMGRPRKKGKRLPTLQQVLDDDKTSWTTVTVEHWYSRTARQVEIVSGTAVWYHGGMPSVPLRYVLVRDSDGKFTPQALLCTDLCADPTQVLSWFVLRWQLETTFQRRPFKRCAPIWAWRRSASGTTWPLCAQLPPCWLCSRWLRCLPTSKRPRRLSGFARPRGMSRCGRPSRMRWLRCGGSFGRGCFFAPARSRRTARNSRAR